jgi:hypothetical protein
VAAIPGLPAELRTVPPGPAGPDDPERDEKRQAWRNWRDQVRVYREQRHLDCERDPALQEIEREKCKRSTPYFLAVWGCLFEPRKRKQKVGYGGEFIPFAKQVDLLDTFRDCLASEGEGPLSDLAVSKSRDVGASWCMCGEAVKQWLFDQDVQIRLVSYKEELVESKKSGSLFWKIDYLIKHLPQWMVPQLNDVHLILTNLENGNVIGGEATTKRSVRGDRASWMFFDEAAVFEEFAEMWTGTVAAADTRVAVSSIHTEYGPDFFNLSMNDEWPVEDRPQRLAIDWWDHPLHDEAWLDNEKKRYKLNEAGFFREVLRNPFEGVKTFVYPEARTTTPSAEYRYNPELPQYNTLDPGQADDFAIVFLQEDPYTGLVHVIDGYSNSQKPADYYGTVIVGEPEPGLWDYDSEAHRIMAFTKGRKAGTTYGDMSGFSKEGATMDSVYNRLVKYGIVVTRDRMKDGKVSQARRMARSYKGRRESMRDLWLRLRFADTPGAMRVLEALKMNRFKPGDRDVSSEDRAPLHDWTSHYTSAMEFYAANKRLEREIAGAQMMPAAKPSRFNQTRNRDTYDRWQRQSIRRSPW